MADLLSSDYYSATHSLADSNPAYSLIQQNKLPERFEALFSSFYHGQSYSDNNSFRCAELGFGTGLNVLLIWQLWCQIKTATETKLIDNKSYVTSSLFKSRSSVRPPRLHIISTEKHPLDLENLGSILKGSQSIDPSLSPFIDQLLNQYPTLIAGCHRLHLDTDVTLDLWLGDTTVTLTKLTSSYPPLTNKTKQPKQTDQSWSNSNSQLVNQIYIDAWCLNESATSSSELAWSEELGNQVSRLSKSGTTVATFNNSDETKQGLISAGFETKLETDFATNRPLLTAVKQANNTLTSNLSSTDLVPEPSILQIAVEEVTLKKLPVIEKVLSQQKVIYREQTKAQRSDNDLQKVHFYGTNEHNTKTEHVAVIGAGIAGLMSAWSLAERGIQVTLLDKTAPLAGASGNPRALLAPKMTPLSHVAEHLHSISYLYSLRRYQQLDQWVDSKQSETIKEEVEYPIFTKIARQQLPYHQNIYLAKQPITHRTRSYKKPKIFEQTATLDLLLKANVEAHQIAEYPPHMASTLDSKEAKQLTGLKQQDLANNLYLSQAGLVNPEAIANTILDHPNISFIPFSVNRIDTKSTMTKDSVSGEGTTEVNLRQRVTVYGSSTEGKNSDCGRKEGSIVADAVVIAIAYQSQSLDSRIFEFRKIRGQLSWFAPTERQLKNLPKLPLKYGGYCAVFEETSGTNTCGNSTTKEGYSYSYPVSRSDSGSGFDSRSGSTPFFLLGASFVRNDTSTDIRDSEHMVNRDKLITAIPELTEVLTSQEGSNDFSGWQARVGIRAQTPDYHPLVGQVDEEGLIWTLSGMGSKGFSFAPLCAEVLADMMTGQFAPLSDTLLAKLSPHRKSLQKPLST